MNCIVARVEALDGTIHSFRIQSKKKNGRVTDEEFEKIREGLLDDGWEILYYELIEVQ